MVTARPKNIALRDSGELQPPSAPQLIIMSTVLCS